MLLRSFWHIWPKGPTSTLIWAYSCSSPFGFICIVQFGRGVKGFLGFGLSLSLFRCIIISFFFNAWLWIQECVLTWYAVFISTSLWNSMNCITVRVSFPFFLLFFYFFIFFFFVLKKHWTIEIACDLKNFLTVLNFHLFFINAAY